MIVSSSPSTRMVPSVRKRTTTKATTMAMATTRSSLRKPVSCWMVSICGFCLVWNNLSWGGRYILSTTFVEFPDHPRDNHNRNTGVVADPYSLKKGVESFLLQDRYHHRSRSHSLWDLLEGYPVVVVPSPTPERQQRTLQKAGEQHNDDDEKEEFRPFYYYEHDILSSEIVCGAGPGRGMEQDAGYKLLVEKIRILDARATPTKPTTTTAKTRNRQPKLLCLVYTYSPMRHLLRAQALMWGRHCDGFLAFSNETLPELGIYQLPTNENNNNNKINNNGTVEESYNAMWQKTRGLWKHVHDNFLTSFDYFYLSGDDVYLLVNNLRAYLQELESTTTTASPRDGDSSVRKQPRHFGSWLPGKSMVAGGPGYVLNRVALQRYVGTVPGETITNAGSNRNSSKSSNTNTNTNSVWSTCRANIHRPYEDRYLSECLSSELGIWGNATDTRDKLTGEQRFHDTDPATLYLFRAESLSNNKRTSYFSRMAKIWEDQPMPSGSGAPHNSNNNNTNLRAIVGPKHELEAASKHSISLHRIFTPTYMARIHAILHPREACPIDSPLGRGLKRNGVFGETCLPA